MQISSNTSTLRSIGIGVPQGGILGTILFMLCVNDITNISETLSPILFADDTMLSISHCNYSHLINILNHELECIQT